VGGAGRLLGRDAELRRLDGVLGAVDRRGAALVVVGEPGIGKSALLAEVAARAEGRGMAVLRLSGVQAESHLPFAGLHQALEPVLGRVDDLPPPQSRALLAAFGQIDAEVGDMFGVALATLTLLRERAAEAPVLLVAEDTPWLDPMSADVLAFVARRVADDPVVVLASAREVPPGPLADAGLEEVPLTPLDPATARWLVDRHAPGLAAPLRDRLLEEAGGNPLALVELAASWSALPPGTLLTSWVPVTDRLTRAFADRAGSLPAPSRAVLLVAAVNDGDSTAEALAAAAVVAGAPVDAGALVPAEAAGLVEPAGAALRFRHPLVRSAMRGAAGLAERQAAHAALAGVVADPDRVAWHRASAAVLPDEDVARDLEAAAARARRRGAVVDAVAALERAADLSPAELDRGRRLVRAAELADELGRGDVTQRLLDAAEPLALDPLDRLRVEWRRGVRAEGVWRDVGRMRSLLDVTGRMSRAGDVDMALDALVAVASAGWWTSVGADRRVLVAEAVDRLPVAADDPRRLAVLALAAPVERGPGVLERLAAIGPASVGEPGGLALLGIAAGAVGSADLSEQFLAPATRRLRDEGRLGALAEALVGRAWAAWHRGAWGVAASAAEEARRLGEEAERPAVVAASRLVEAALAAVRGDPAAAEETAAAVDERYGARGGTTMQALAAMVRGLAAQADGRADDAYALLAPLVGPSDDGSAAVAGQAAVTLYVDAAAQTGRLGEAREAIGALEDLARRAGSPMMAASVTYAGPLLAGDDDRAEALFQAALGGPLAPWPFAAARLRLAYGAWLRRRRRVGDSRASLRAARDACDALGAVAWGERARQELRAAGEASGPRPEAAVELLTAQEAEIVRLAARGLTNREIGRRLYLSHRTVGSHLYHAFPKLGITSRGELAGVLGDADAGVTPD
jgi:DNA-binding CsgD family transcriptional regulator